MRRLSTPARVVEDPPDSPPDAGDTDTDTDTDLETDTIPDEPEISRRERTLAWLADESFRDGLPAPTARTGAGGSVPRIILPDEPMEFVRPDAVKGVYVNAWAAGSGPRSQVLIDLAIRTEINAFVIDLKDASGYVSYPTHAVVALLGG